MLTYYKISTRITNTFVKHISPSVLYCQRKMNAFENNQQPVFSLKFIKIINVLHTCDSQAFVGIGFLHSNLILIKQLQLCRTAEKVNYCLFTFDDVDNTIGQT